MKKGLIFYRNLSTNQPFELDYDYYFYSQELFFTDIAHFPEKYKKLFEQNLSLRVHFIKNILKELENYLKKPILPINLNNYYALKQKNKISRMDIYLSWGEHSLFENLVDLVFCNKTEILTHNFTKFYGVFKEQKFIQKYVPKTTIELDLYKKIASYEMKNYSLRRTKISSLGSLISPYVSCGVITVEQLIPLILTLHDDSLGRDEYLRQVAWVVYCKIKKLPEKTYPLLDENKQKLL